MKLFKRLKKSLHEWFKAMADLTCDHKYYKFGDQKFRRCVNCCQIEPTKSQ